MRTGNSALSLQTLYGASHSTKRINSSAFKETYPLQCEGENTCVHFRLSKNTLAGDSAQAHLFFWRSSRGSRLGAFCATVDKMGFYASSGGVLCTVHRLTAQSAILKSGQEPSSPYPLPSRGCATLSPKSKVSSSGAASSLPPSLTTVGAPLEMSS